MHVTILLLYTDDVWRVIRFILIYLVLVEGEETKLEEVLDDDCDLEGKTKHKTKVKLKIKLWNET